MTDLESEAVDNDDELIRFEANGATPLPTSQQEGFVENDGARIWYGSYGAGPVLVLLHGGLGNSRNWGSLLPLLLESGHRVVLIDSRGHGRSTRDERLYSYELMGADVLAVMDALGVETAKVVGWSDGACTGVILGHRFPARVDGVVFFACNVDPSGTKPFEPSPSLDRCLTRHRKDYAELSATPEAFDALMEAVGLMQRTQPNYAERDLAEISVPVLVLHAEFDEFIRREHLEYLARALPLGEFGLLPGVSHFAPVQRPAEFGAAVLRFVERDEHPARSGN